VICSIINGRHEMTLYYLAVWSLLAQNFWKYLWNIIWHAIASLAKSEINLIISHTLSMTRQQKLFCTSFYNKRIQFSWHRTRGWVSYSIYIYIYIYTSLKHNMGVDAYETNNAMFCTCKPGVDVYILYVQMTA